MKLQQRQGYSHSNRLTFFSHVTVLLALGCAGSPTNDAPHYTSHPHMAGVSGVELREQNTPLLSQNTGAGSESNLGKFGFCLVIELLSISCMCEN